MKSDASCLVSFPSILPSSHLQGRGNASEERVLSNQFARENARFKLPMVLEKLARGQPCFDFEFYLRRNEDLVKPRSKATWWSRGAKPLLNASDEEMIWEHFVYFGQFETNREFR